MADANNETQQTGTQDQKGAAQGLGLWLGGFLAVVLIIGVAVWLKWYHTGSSDGSSAFAGNDSGARVIVINTSRIVAAATKKVLADPNANPAAEGARLSAKLSEVMAEYRKGNSLILNGYNVLYVPPDMDKTAEVAEKVGVKLE